MYGRFCYQRNDFLSPASHTQENIHGVHGDNTFFAGKCTWSELHNHDLSAEQLKLEGDNAWKKNTLHLTFETYD